MKISVLRRSMIATVFLLHAASCSETAKPVAPMTGLGPVAAAGTPAIAGAPVQSVTGGAVVPQPPVVNAAGTGGTVAGTGGSSVGAGGSPAGAGGTSAGTGGMPAPKMGTLPPVDSVEKDGPYAVTINMMAGANSWVFRPTELGKDGVKHPIFVWGTGATSVPSRYTDHFSRVASHGFVVISPNTGSVNAGLLKASLDWILAENGRADSEFYQKLDAAKIAMGGHSLGSVSTFDQEAMESRLVTTIHIAGGSFDAMGSSKVKTPTAYMCGQMDLDLASPNCKVDFDKATAPTYFVQLAGVNHVDAARSALPGMVAWLRWHLAGEDFRKSMFVGAGCDFCKGIWANAQTEAF